MRELLRRLSTFLRRQRWEDDLQDEFESHIAMAVDENRRSGMTEEEARRQAMLRFGGTESAKELHREARSLPFLEMLLQDVRYAARAMRRDTAFTVLRC